MSVMNRQRELAVLLLTCIQISSTKLSNIYSKEVSPFYSAPWPTQYAARMQVVGLIAKVIFGMLSILPLDVHAAIQKVWRRKSWYNSIP